jgi:hypothetical protein
MPCGKTQASLNFIDACFQILTEIQPAGVRATAYRLFVRKLLPSMHKTHVNKVSAQLVYAREQGIIPWEWIVDGSRAEERALVWKDLAECLRITRRSYRRDYWLQQPIRLGVWSEKETVRGTLAPVLDQYQVPFLFTHGHNSTTRTHESAALEQRDSRRWVVLYVGDWDPSGMDMSERDLPQRLVRYGSDVEIIRLAIVADDLPEMARQGLTFDTRDKEQEAERRYGPHTRKGKDTRRPWFERHYGRVCCELDAMNPNELRARMERAIREWIDPLAWERMREIEAAECDSLQDIHSRWHGPISGQSHAINPGAYRR